MIAQLKNLEISKSPNTKSVKEKNSEFSGLLGGRSFINKKLN
jgi:hypothetical protein